MISLLGPSPDLWIRLSRGRRGTIWTFFPSWASDQRRLAFFASASATMSSRALSSTNLGLPTGEPCRELSGWRRPRADARLRYGTLGSAPSQKKELVSDFKDPGRCWRREGR